MAKLKVELRVVKHLDRSQSTHVSAQPLAPPSPYHSVRSRPTYGVLPFDLQHRFHALQKMCWARAILALSSAPGALSSWTSRKSPVETQAGVVCLCTRAVGLVRTSWRCSSPRHSSTDAIQPPCWQRNSTSKSAGPAEVGGCLLASESLSQD